MIPSFIKNLFNRADIPAPAEKEAESPYVSALDPLDPSRHHNTGKKGAPWKEEKEVEFRSAKDFPVQDGLAGEEMRGGTKKALMDAATILNANAKRYVADDSDGTGMLKAGPNAYTVPEGVFNWYMSQGFIGYQACAILAQQWLVDKACSMSGEDAVRNGWVLKARGGEELSDEDHEALIEADKKFKVKENLIELNRFKNVFGIRVVIFQVSSDDPLYYEKPFNIDGVTENSYTGMSQVDPYWMMPVMTSKGTSDPADKDFYEPEYWVISGKKYHKSHLCIVRGPQPADILKPTYIFGGVPLTQRIYERVYAAERTANEAPLMAMSKRTMAIHADLERVMADQASFEARLLTWIRYRDNHGVKVLGKDEQLEQFDINMSDFDSIIMNQYQLVSAISKTPATKLLGTQPKGFNASGDYETKTYNQELESIQEHTMMPCLTRHYDISARSLGIKTDIEVVCNEVDSVTTKERADLNKLKSDIGVSLINAGVISPDEERQRIRDDEHSGYNRLTNDDANDEPGMSPENIAALTKASGEQERGNAAQTTANNGEATHEPDEDSAVNTVGSANGAASNPLAALIPVIAQGLVSRGNVKPQTDPMGVAALAILALMAGKSNSDNEAALNELGNVTPPIQGTKPGTRGVNPTVGGIHNVVGEVADSALMDWNPKTLPKVRVHGLTCMIENPRNSIRKGISADGKPWAVKMANHYGFIKGHEGADGDEVDCFLGPNLRSQDVYVIQQKGLEGEFDEHKCMLGFDSEEDANAAYHANFKPGWDGFDACQKMSIADFKEWLAAGCAAKPLTHRA